jgi:aerobic-type carbon monoxide dehydrogenase small subunit (CoxS/CutS family)
METAPASVQMLPITVTVNGTTWSGEVAAEAVLLELLRQHIGLTGTKRSCESQVCGACTVLVDNRPVSACSYLAFEVNGRSVTTIEGLGTPENPDALQTAFARNMAFQCGYCISGQIMAARALLLENPAPSYDDIAEWMVGNTCRCGCYAAIARAIQEAAPAQLAPAAR